MSAYVDCIRIDDRDDLDGWARGLAYHAAQCLGSHFKRVGNGRELDGAVLDAAQDGVVHVDCVDVLALEQAHGLFVDE